MPRAPFPLRWLAVAIGALAVLATDAQQDQADAAFDRTPQDCIQVSLIDETDAIDDQNLIFRMRGDRVYRSHLPRKCPGLARENRIAYETRGGRLCAIDTITVLERFGVGFQRGFTCRLGEFVPLSPEEIEDLEFREEGGRQRESGIEAKPVEIETDDTSDDGDEPAEAEE
jgi:hypothetical protein